MPPIADVVVADQVGSTEIEQAGDGLANHHWAQVADVCLLGGIGTRIVDDDFATVLEGFSAALVVLFGGKLELPLPDELRRERKINEARASDIERDKRRVEFVGGFCSRDQAARKFARIEPVLLGKGKHAIGLIVAETWISRAHAGHKLAAEAFCLSCDCR